MTRAHLPHNPVLKDVLLAEAEFADANSTAVRARGEKCERELLEKAAEQAASAAKSATESPAAPGRPVAQAAEAVRIQ
jgi:hypothetical protein